MRNKLWVALGGAGVLAVILAVFAAGAPGQTAQPAPSKVPGPQIEPAPQPSALESQAQAAEAKILDRESHQLAQLSAKLAEADANLVQGKVLSELQAKLANLDLDMKSMEPAMQEAEKKAAALPAKLTVPMIVFFLPCLFVVILGPAVMRVMQTLHH